MNVRGAFYEVLRAHGITTIFRNRGSNELPLLRDFPGDFRYILALHGGAAIGMADGFAQATGRPTLVNLHAAVTPWQTWAWISSAVMSICPQRLYSKARDSVLMPLLLPSSPRSARYGRRSEV